MGNDAFVKRLHWDLMIILGWVGVFFISKICSFFFFTLFFLLLFLFCSHSYFVALCPLRSIQPTQTQLAFCLRPLPPSFFPQEIFHPCPPLLYVSPCKYFTLAPVFSCKYSPQHPYFPNCKYSTQVNLQPNPFSAFTYLFLV